MSSSERGIIYVVTGRRHADEAYRSARRAKRWMPELPISIFTDQQFDADDVFDQMIVIPQGSGFLSKVVHIRNSPYPQTLFLDSDTHVVSDVRPLFELLHRFDLAASHAPYRITYDIDGVPECFPEYNTGVLLYRRNSNTDELWDLWIRNYNEDLTAPLSWRFPGGADWFGETPSDQPSFRKALYQSSVTLATLPAEFNCRLPFPGFLQSKVQIIHGRSNNLEADTAILNHAEIPRVHLMRWGRLTSFHSSMPPVNFTSSLIWSLHHRGLLQTALVAIRRILFRSERKSAVIHHEP